MITTFLVGRRDPIQLDTFRMATGIGMIGFMAQWWFDDAAERLTSEGFHLSAQAAGSAWLSPPPLPLWALAPFGAAFFGTMLAFTVGFRLRLTTPAVLIFMLFVSHVDPAASYTPNNLFIVTLAVLCVAPRGCYWSVDRVPIRSVSVWPVRILQATLLMAYVGAGACKLRGEWMSNSHTLRTFALGFYRTDAAAWLLRHWPTEAWTLIQSLSLAFELLAPLLFAVRRFRGLGFVWGAGMHMGIGIMMDEFGWFSVQMVSFYILFMESATLHAVRERLDALLGRRMVWRPSPPSGPRTES